MHFRKTVQWPSFVLLLFAAIPAGSQTLHTVDSLQKAEQACLDQGMQMENCSYRLYTQMDSLLNLVYRRKMATLSPQNKAAFKAGQIKWLAARDTYFRSAEKKWGSMQGEHNMELYDDKAAFVGKRVTELIRQ